MNILVITPIYPGPGIGENFTKVVHYFAKEWVDMGENVQVVNIPSYFPKILYHMPKWATDFIQKKFSAAIPNKRNSKIESFHVDNVPVMRIPLYKPHPWSRISQSVFSKASKEIIAHLNEIGFTPDIIVAHWFDPSIVIASTLKKEFGCKMSIVVHNHSFKYKDYIDSPDLWGYRSVQTVDFFRNVFPSVHLSFRCVSGVPESFFKNNIHRDWSSITSFVYVGTLIKRKYPDVVIDALKMSDIDNFLLNIIGDGGMQSILEKKINSQKLKDNVHLLGRLKRDEIISVLDKSDVFVMVSRGEVFGLVYLEAMARGCIVVASENEGMQGIIRNGENGFLVPAGDTEELLKTLNRIQNMTPEQRRIISENGRNTAHNLSNKKVADDYLVILQQLSTEA